LGDLVEWIAHRHTTTVEEFHAVLRIAEDYELLAERAEESASIRSHVPPNKSC
jgi:hypothetical protein